MTSKVSKKCVKKSANKWYNSWCLDLPSIPALETSPTLQNVKGGTTPSTSPCPSINSPSFSFIDHMTPLEFPASFSKVGLSQGLPPYLPGQRLRSRKRNRPFLIGVGEKEMLYMALRWSICSFFLGENMEGNYQDASQNSYQNARC